MSAAESWIKMRTALHDAPKVVRLAAMLPGLPADHRVRVACVVGLLHRTWALADTHTADGVLTGYTGAALDAVLGVPGWSAALASVGWARVADDGITLTDFDVHNGSSAKRRAQEAARKRAVRSVSASDADEKRTSCARPLSLSLSLSGSGSGEGVQGEGDIPPHADDMPREAAPPEPDAPDVLDRVLREVEFGWAPPTIASAAAAWRQHRLESGLRPLTRASWRRQLRDAIRDPAGWVAAVEWSIRQGYSGIHAPSGARGPQPTRAEAWGTEIERILVRGEAPDSARAARSGSDPTRGPSFAEDVLGALSGAFPAAAQNGTVRR